MTLTIHDKPPKKSMFQHIKDEARNATIEECATAVKDYGEENILSYGMDGLLAAIRALKDKP